MFFFNVISTFVGVYKMSSMFGFSILPNTFLDQHCYHCCLFFLIVSSPLFAYFSFYFSLESIHYFTTIHVKLVIHHSLAWHKNWKEPLRKHLTSPKKEAVYKPNEDHQENRMSYPILSIFCYLVDGYGPDSNFTIMPFCSITRIWIFHWEIILDLVSYNFGVVVWQLNLLLC